MFKHLTQKNGLQITFKTESLDQSQVRLIKRLNSTLSNLLTAQNEEEFFESSKDLLRLCASSIKQSNFSSNLPKSYSDQAIEFALDELTEAMNGPNIVNLDN